MKDKRMSHKGSAPLSLSAQDMCKVAKGAIMAIGGALITYVAQYQTSPPTDINTYVSIPAFSILLNFLAKWLTDTKK